MRGGYRCLLRWRFRSYICRLGWRRGRRPRRGCRRVCRGLSRALGEVSGMGDARSWRWPLLRFLWVISWGLLRGGEGAMEICVGGAVRLLDCACFVVLVLEVEFEFGEPQTSRLACTATSPCHTPAGSTRHAGERVWGVTSRRAQCNIIQFYLLLSCYSRPTLRRVP